MKRTHFVIGALLTLFIALFILAHRLDLGSLLKSLHH